MAKIFLNCFGPKFIKHILYSHKSCFILIYLSLENSLKTSFELFQTEVYSICLLRVGKMTKVVYFMVNSKTSFC